MALSYKTLATGSSGASQITLITNIANYIYEITGYTGYSALYQLSASTGTSLSLEAWSNGSYITTYTVTAGQSVNITQNFDKLVWQASIGGQNVVLSPLANVPTPIAGVATVYTSSGTYTSTGYGYAVCIGGGGGGLNGNAYVDTRYGGWAGPNNVRGGKAGLYTIGYRIALTSNMTVTVGGAGGSNGGNGGTSSFGGVSAAGGTGNTTSGTGSATTLSYASRQIANALSINSDTLSYSDGAGSPNTYTTNAGYYGGTAAISGNLGTGGSSGDYYSQANSAPYRGNPSAYVAAGNGGNGSGYGSGGGAGGSGAYYNPTYTGYSQYGGAIARVANGTGGTGATGLVVITRFAS